MCLIIKLLYYCCSPIIRANYDDNTYVLKVNDIMLTSQNIREIQDIYYKYKNKSITIEDLRNLFYVYYYLMLYVNSGDNLSMIDREVPKELEAHKWAFVLRILWNEEEIMNTYKSRDNGAGEENISNNGAKSDQYINYTLINGHYKDKTPPTLAHMDKIFKPMRNSNFIGGKTYGSYYDVQVCTMQSHMDVRPPLIIDPIEKKFSYVLLTSKIDAHTKYDVFVFIGENPYSTMEAFQIIESNTNVKPDDVVELCNYYNLQCKKSQTILYSFNLDVHINQLLEDGAIGTYILIPHSNYIIYLVKKSRCPRSANEDEEVLKEKSNQALENFFHCVIVKSEDIPWEEWENILYG